MRDGRLVLDAVTLRVAFPENVAILGPNGAGKSTLLRLIAREAYPVPNDATVCRILGRDRWNVFALRSQLGIVSAQLTERVASDATVADVVASTLAAPDPGAVDEALARLGLSTLARRSAFALSSGEWGRTMIARALVHRPRALILDEPFTALDVAARRDVRAALRDLAGSGVGIVLVTHDVADILPEIERVVFVRDGRVVADGRKRDLIASQPLGDLFGIALSVVERDGWYDVS